MRTDDPNDLSALNDLYQEVILDHYRRPQNAGVLEGADRRALGHNPLCGDRFEVSVKLSGDVIEAIRFRGQGCAISTASASLMTESVLGKRREEAAALFDRFHRMVTGGDGGDADLGKLAAFSGVSAFPVRVKCATLVWHTLQAALAGAADPVTTEE